MAVTVRALQPRVTYLLTIVGESGNLELLRWTLSTGAVTSPAPVSLPDEVTAQLALRLRWLTAYVPADALPEQPGLLADLCAVRDGRQEASASVVPGETETSLVVGPLDAGTTYYVLFSIPTTYEAALC